MPIPDDAVGRRFGNLVVENVVGALCDCKCDCGKSRVAYWSELVSGKRYVSCGCQRYAGKLKQGQVLHGKETPTYRSYKRAKARCNNPRNLAYHNYGERGIEFRFTSFEDFYKELGDRPSLKHSIERKDNNGHYEPGNVKWALSAEQARNKSTNIVLTHGQQSQTISDWADQLKRSRDSFFARFHAGWCTPCILFNPKHTICVDKEEGPQ